MDDLNATPIDKLQPIMTSKSDMGRAEPPSYQEMLSSIDAARGGGGGGLGPPPPGGAAFEDPRMAQQPPPMQQDPRMYQDQRPPVYDREEYYPPQRTHPQRTHTPSRRPSRQSAQPLPPTVAPAWYTKIWKQHKRVIIVALVILLILWFGLPKLRTFPRFTNEYQQLNTFGSIAAAAGGAAVFGVADKFT